jgi:hypothetical protein
MKYFKTMTKEKLLLTLLFILTFPLLPLIAAEKKLGHRADRMLDLPFGETISAYTLEQDACRWSISSGVQKRDDNGKLYSIPRVAFTKGLGPSTDIEISWEYLSLKDAFFFDDNSGSGDIRIRLKTSLNQTMRSRTGMYMITKLPDADETTGLGTDQTDFHWGFSYSRITPLFNLSISAGIGILGKPEVDNRTDMIYLRGLNFYNLASTINDPGKGDYREITGQTDVFDYGLALHFQPWKRLSWALEISGFNDSETVYKELGQVRAGLFYKTENNGVINLFLGKGIGDSLPESSLYAGYTKVNF